MAYLAFDTIDAGRPVDAPPATSVPPIIAAAESAPSTPSRLDALEWSVVSLARHDRLSSLRAAGRITSAWRAILLQPNPRLADDRLEALRRMAVLAWHHSFQVPSRELRAFFEAGFSVGQYEAMMANIVATRASEPRRR